MQAPQLVRWAHTKFGRSDAPDVESLIAQVAEEALADAGLEAGDVDAIHVGVYNHGFSAQGFEAALVGSMTPTLARVPAVRAENACATGSAALYGAFDRVEAGRARTVLVIGAEKMSDAPNRPSSTRSCSAPVTAGQRPRSAASRGSSPTWPTRTRNATATRTTPWP